MTTTLEFKGFIPGTFKLKITLRSNQPLELNLIAIYVFNIGIDLHFMYCNANYIFHYCCCLVAESLV